MSSGRATSYLMIGAAVDLDDDRDEAAAMVGERTHGELVELAGEP